MIDACVARVYEAGLDPEAWPEAIGGISDAFGGAKIGLLHFDRASLNMEGWSRGLDPDTWTGGTEDRVRGANPSLELGLSAPIGAIIDRRAFIDDSGMDRHPMRRNFFAPNGMFHLMMSTVQRDRGSASFLFISRRRAAAPFEPADQALASALAGHLGRAMRIYRALRLSEARTLAFAQALDHLAGGVLLADASLRVLHANPAGERMLEGGVGVARRLGRIVLGDPLAQQRLERAAARLCQGGPDIGDVHLEARRHDRPPLRVSVLLAAGGATAAIAPRASLLIIIRDPEEEAAPRAAALAAAFGLTAAESRVAALAVVAASTREIAAGLDLSENTVKTHLKAVYQKTGAQSRADLVRLALAL